jgi:holo-[acyl-carrier protein] synthase
MNGKQSFSVGTDIVDVKRVSRMISNPRFLNRIFTADEIRYCKGKKNMAQHFAVRFAAKEAIWKALSCVFHAKKGIAHKELGVRRAPNGQPFALFSKRLKKFEAHLSLSLSHTKEYAVAVALYCGEGGE